MYLIVLNGKYSLVISILSQSMATLKANKVETLFSQTTYFMVLTPQNMGRFRPKADICSMLVTIGNSLGIHSTGT